MNPKPHIWWRVPPGNPDAACWYCKYPGQTILSCGFGDTPAAAYRDWIEWNALP